MRYTPLRCDSTSRPSAVCSILRLAAGSTLSWIWLVAICFPLVAYYSRWTAISPRLPKHRARMNSRPCSKRMRRFSPWGANASSLTNDRAIWRKYREVRDHLSQHFDSGALAPPRIPILGGLSSEVVTRAHALLENNAVQGKLIMTCSPGAAHALGCWASRISW